MSPSDVKTALTRDSRNLDRHHRRPIGSARRSRRVVENDDYAAFTRRIIAAHARRIATGDIEGLAELADLAVELDAALRHAIRGLRAAGYSWADIAVRLGVTRQAAQQRFTEPGGAER